MKNEKKILKLFNNELSKEEIEALRQSEDLNALEKIAHYSSHLEAPKIDEQKALKEFKERELQKNNPKVRTLNLKMIYRIAAMLVVMLGASYFMFFNNNKSFETQIAQTETLYLPDDSEVILNSNSNLRYNKKTWKDSRNLILDGEAFFKVKKGQKFTVNTDAGIVQVLGTQFNVKKRFNYFEVQCYEGLVAVSYNDNDTKLTPGKTFRVLNGEIQMVEDFSAKSPSWVHAESTFFKIPLSQVIDELEIQYDIKISVKDIDVDQLFTGTFTHKNKDIALKSVTIPLNLGYRRSCIGK